MKSIVALVLSLNFCVSVAKAVEAIQASDQYVDKQAEYKKAFERAQAYHEQTLHRLRFEKPATIEEQQISVIQSIKLSTTETRNYLQNFWSNLINMPVIESVRGAWKKFSGTLSTPPVATGLFYIFNTAGTVPEVLWIPDGAYDPDGTIDRFEFDFGDGTSQVIPYADFDSAKTVSHVYAANGTYNASVKIVDNSGDFSMYYGSVTVVSNNQLPVPKFAMQYNQVPNFLKLDLTSQATDDNGIIRHTWRFGDGSSDSVGTSNTSVSRTYTNPGMYLIQYVVRDSHRGQITGWTHAYVGQPQPPGGSYPVPLIYADTHAGVAPLQVNFDGEKSFDVGGSIASYEWNFGDFSHPKNISYQAKPSFRYTQPGTYYGSLKVTDNGGRFNTRYFAVYVSPAAPNTLEPAEITVIPNAAARSFSFDSNYRSIHASVPSYYQIWDFGDGTPIVKGSYPTHVYGSEGTYTVTLRVYDVKGGFQQIQKNLIVGSNQSSPTSTFYADNPNTKVLTPINFITSNPTWVSPTTTAKWSFGDGTVQTGLHKDLLNVSHTYTQRGLYPVDLVVTDEFGKSSYYTIYVNIQTSSQPINAMIDLSARVGKIPLPIRFDASESSSSAGAISNYYWRIAGPSGIQTSQSKVWTNNYTTGGERYVDLYVEDNQGNSGWASDVFAAIDPAQVPAGNNIPVANVQLDFSFNGASTMIHPSGWFSNDPDGDRIVSYEWILDGSPVSSKPNFSYNLNGTLQHLLALRVTDKWGAVGERKVSFKNPQVSFDFAPTKPVFSEPVYFTADEETIKLPDGNQPVSFEWDFGDGTSVQNGQTVNHIFTAAGSYNVRLKMLDNWQRAYYVFKNVNIYNPDTFTAIISAKTADGIEHGKSGGIISSMRFPDTIIFDLYESDVVGEGVKSATWDFGNGNTGFGLTPEFTYQQPGVYTVSVNATDSNNNTSVSTMQVKILSWDCSDSDGVNGCLKLVNAQGNVFPMSPSEWIITHDTGGTQTWTPDIGDTDYVELIPLDDSGGAASINITSAIVLDGQNLKIQKSVLQSLNIDFYKEYQLDVHTKLSDGKNYFGTFPRVVFGVGTVDISAAESDVQIVVKGAKGFTKYLDLGANLTYQLKELPIDSYSFVATKDTRRQIYHLTVTNSSVLNLAVDLSAVSIKERDENWKDYFPKFNKAVPKYLMNEGENWQQDGCGNPSPFPLAIDGPRPGRGISAVWLSSKSGENQITNRKLTKAFGKELKMYCAISSKYNEYELNKYMTVGAVGRCDIDPQGAAYAWSWYLSAYGGMASLPVTVRWTIVDDASAKQTSGSYNTTLAEAMRSNGIQPENINTKIGTVDHAGTMHLWGPNFKPKVKIPGNFLRPRMSMTMQGLHSVAPNPWYQVSCQIEKEDEILPRVLDVVTADLPASIQMHSPIDNGKRFLTGKFFPIGIDDTLTSMSGSFKLPDIFKAKIKLKMHSGTGYPEDVDRIKIKLRYDDQEVGSHTYSLAQQNYEDVLPGSSNFSIVLDLDADDFKSMVAYVPGVKDKKLSFEFIPLGP
ncbi:MAG: PKD domain-containing protein, partial [Bdellovibrio sp.]|nr:PKD domain-containing protein [Bdellovibrio sp.]